MKKIQIQDCNHSQVKKIEVYKKQFIGVWSLFHVEVFEPGEIIIDSNRKVDQLRFLAHGRCKILMIHEDGNRSIVHFVQQDEFIGELSFTGVEDRPKDVVAISQCICLSIPMRLAKEKLLKDADFLLLLNQYIVKKLLNRTWFSTKSQNYEFKNRLAAYILMSECHGKYSEKHTETSEFLGTSYRHLLYTIKQFIEDGILVKEKKGYTFNRQALEELAMDINDNKGDLL